MKDLVETRDYEYEMLPLTRQSDYEQIGTVVYFEDLPLTVGRDVEMDYPRHAFFEYETEIVVQELEHFVVKAVADDESPLITQAVFFSPEANNHDVATFWARLHGFGVDDGTKALEG